MSLQKMDIQSEKPPEGLRKQAEGMASSEGEERGTLGTCDAASVMDDVGRVFTAYGHHAPRAGNASAAFCRREGRLCEYDWCFVPATTQVRNKAEEEQQGRSDGQSKGK